jgi:hypothetical protein
MQPARITCHNVNLLSTGLEILQLMNVDTRDFEEKHEDMMAGERKEKQTVVQLPSALHNTPIPITTHQRETPDAHQRGER